MSEELSKEAFAKHLNSTFSVVFDSEQSIDLELKDIVDGVETPRQESFSVIFHGPKDVHFPQGIREMRHASMGTLNLFLVPIGIEEGRILYEAVFNRIRNQGKSA